MKTGTVTCCSCCDDSTPARAVAESGGVALTTFQLAAKLLLVTLEFKIPVFAVPLADAALPAGVRVVIKSLKRANGPFTATDLVSTCGCLGKAGVVNAGVVNAGVATCAAESRADSPGVTDLVLRLSPSSCWIRI